VVDRDRLLAKLDELDGYLGELRSIAPRTLDEYRKIEKKRACERLIQIAVATLIDACVLLVSGLRLGLPGEEDDLFDKLARHGVLSSTTAQTVKRMKGLRNQCFSAFSFSAFTSLITFSAMKAGTSS